MPETLHALLLFAFFVVPGFLLQRGYLRTRAHGSIEADFHVFVEAVVGSLFLLAVAWPYGGKSVLQWSEAGTLGQHADAAYRLAVGLLLAPYPVGLVTGWIVNLGLSKMEMARAKAVVGSKRDWLFRVLDESALLEGPSVWDSIWSQFLRHPVYVRVKTKTGEEIVGSFEDGSWVGLSPEPRQLFLSTVYREKTPGSHQWETVPRTKGVFIDATEIELIEFAD